MPRFWAACDLCSNEVTCTSVDILMPCAGASLVGDGGSCRVPCTLPYGLLCARRRRVELQPPPRPCKGCQGWLISLCHLSTLLLCCLLSVLAISLLHMNGAFDACWGC